MATARGEYRFTVKEHWNHVPWVAAEPAGGGIALLDQSVIGLELGPETTIEEAGNLARILNEQVVAISLTTFKPSGGVLHALRHFATFKRGGKFHSIEQKGP